MSLVNSINRFISIFLDTFRQLGRGRIWLVLFGYFVVNWVVLYAHFDFLNPIFHGPVKAWVHLVDSQLASGFTHYPGHFLLLPHFFDWAKFFIGLVFEGLVLGTIAIIFFDSFLEVEKEERLPFSTALKAWPHLIIGWILINGLMLAVTLILPNYFEDWLFGSPRRMIVFQYGIVPGIYTFILAVFYFLIPSIIVFGENSMQALRRSVSIFIRNPFTCLFLSFFMLVPIILVSFASGQPGVIVEKFKPELVYWILLFGLVVDAIVYFFWMGTAVRFLVEEDE